MPADTTNLMGEIYDLFSKIYANNTSNQAFLAFETLGIPMTEGMFKLDDKTYSPALAVEHVSDLANMAAHIQDNSVSRGIGTVDGAIELFLDASMPVSADAMTSLGAAKRSASTRFDITLGSMDGVPSHRFHPVYASPTDWYVPTANSNWVSHTSGQPQPQGKTPPQKLITPLVWRVVPAQLQPVISQPVTVAHPLLNVTRAVAVNPQVTTTLAHTAAAAAPAPIATKTKVITTPVVTKPVVRSPELMVAMTKLKAVTTVQPVTTNSMDVSFDHCIVTLNRPWFPDTLLMMRNWYVPGYALGDISNGTGAKDPGQLPVLTTGFVAIRNLRITSKWSQQDLTAIQSSASFGPFSLIGRTYNATTGTLTCSGIQVIGWFCAALPVLPPAADPAKGPAPVG